MLRKIRSLIGLASLLAVAFAPPIAAADPLGSGWTYQGRLQSGGVPADGEFPMLFKLWDAETNGNQVGPTLTFDGAGGNPAPISVADGLFTVSLDFGGGAFGAGARWLEVTVDGVPLTPRQELTAAPHALFSAAPWISSGSTLSYSAGNVGLGTAGSPTARLQVFDSAGSDTVRVDSNASGGTWFNLNNSSTGGATWNLVSTGSGTPEGAGKLLFRANAATKMAIDGSGNTVTFGGLQAAGSNPLSHTQGAYLEWNKSAGTGATYLLNQKGLGAGGFIFGEVSTTNVVTERMRIDGSGKVGIGMAPYSTNLLSVNGDMYAVGTVYGQRAYVTTVDAAALLTDSRIDFGIYDDNSDPINFRREYFGPDRSGLRLTIGDNPGGGANFYDEFQIAAAGTVQFDFTSDGRAFKVGYPGWEVYSDARTKHDIEPLNGALERVLKLKGRTFYYNDPTALGARAGLCIGFVAQEVEPFFPDWIGEARDGLKTLHVSGFEALTVEALRDLRNEKDAQTAALQSQCDALRQENAALTDRLDALEALVAKLARDNTTAEQE